MAPHDRPNRPVRRAEQRATARVLLIDSAGRVLLFEDSDPWLPGPPTFWITPGGGVDPGETVEQAAVREVGEETGHLLDIADLRGPIARRRVVHGYSDKIVEQDETFFVARVESVEVATDGHTEEEQQTMLGHRWWTVEELRRTEATVWPVGIADLVAAAALDGATWPIPISDAEESIVPARAAPPVLAVNDDRVGDTLGGIGLGDRARRPG